MKLSFLTDNLGLKILALLLAIVIYFWLKPVDAKSDGASGDRPASSLSFGKALKGPQTP